MVGLRRGGLLPLWRWSPCRSEVVAFAEDGVPLQGWLVLHGCLVFQGVPLDSFGGALAQGALALTGGFF